jgi:hypothetical protein
MTGREREREVRALAQRLYGFVCSYGGGEVSHGEVLRHLGKDVPDLEGDEELGYEDANVVVLWGLSELLAEAVMKLMNQKLIVLYPVPHGMQLDGGPVPPHMPRVRKPPPRGTKRYPVPHFAPVVLATPAWVAKAEARREEQERREDFESRHRRN